MQPKRTLIRQNIIPLWLCVVLWCAQEETPEERKKRRKKEKARKKKLAAANRVSKCIFNMES